MIFEMLAEAVTQSPPKIDPGWTWSATVGVIQLIVGAPIGGGFLWIGSKAIALQIDKKNETKKQEIDAAAALRGEMMEFNAALQKRVEGLEQTGRDDRKRFDDELSTTRRQHAEEVINIRNGYETEIRALRDEITALRRQMIQWQQASGRAMPLGPNANSRSVEDMGEVLRDAFPVPDGDL